MSGTYVPRIGRVGGLRYGWIVAHLLGSRGCQRPSRTTRDVGVISYGAARANVVLSRFTFTGGPASAYRGNAPAGSFHTVE